MFSVVRPIRIEPPISAGTGRVTRPVPAEIGGSIRIGRTTLNIAK